MNIKEYTKKLQNYYDENKLKEADSYGEGYTDGILEALDYATRLSKELDEPKKVVIPKLIAKLIEGASVIYGNEPLRIAHGIVAKGTSNDNGGSWLSDVNNQKLLLNAIANGYEVEKEKKYRVKLPGLIGSNGQQYISKSMDDKLFACAQRNYLQQEFTNDELKQLPDWIRRLELEEVQDD
ncbi:DUF1642 domain-containing protein [Pediococcus pentosaceus]|uniref:DUF1642 domain-containing protein n=1 Tax=Pediococcus pentosaceus TaxID=1255 RepID=UPI002657BB90|nr:DUF1642 domain-containing protein [Pediococcus pentosaceus]WKF70488.1 DUF1642 domain-containing protein [Pediococcus pentosaceus]